MRECERVLCWVGDTHRSALAGVSAAYLGREGEVGIHRYRIPVLYRMKF